MPALGPANALIDGLLVAVPILDRPFRTTDLPRRTTPPMAPLPLPTLTSGARRTAAPTPGSGRPAPLAITELADQPPQPVPASDPRPPRPWGRRRSDLPRPDPTGMAARRWRRAGNDEPAPPARPGDPIPPTGRDAGERGSVGKEVDVRPRVAPPPLRRAASGPVPDPWAELAGSAADWPHTHDDGPDRPPILEPHPIPDDPAPPILQAHPSHEERARPGPVGWDGATASDRPPPATDAAAASAAVRHDEATAPSVPSATMVWSEESMAWMFRDPDTGLWYRHDPPTERWIAVDDL